jgi:hypothetical protein
MSSSEESTATVGWWLRLQIGLAVGGGAVWLVGAIRDNDFFAGLGAGLLIAALTLRLGRRAAAPDDRDPMEDASS